MVIRVMRVMIIVVEFVVPLDEGEDALPFGSDDPFVHLPHLS